jgi:glutaredoxin-like YruB-family protein
MAKVTIYSTPTCVYCKMAKEFFKKNNVAYEEHDVASDMKAREDMVNKSHQLGVPVIDIDNNIVIGFDQKTIEGLLGLGKVVAPAA